MAVRLRCVWQKMLIAWLIVLVVPIAGCSDCRRFVAPTRPPDDVIAALIAQRLETDSETTARVCGQQSAGMTQVQVLAIETRLLSLSVRVAGVPRDVKPAVRCEAVFEVSFTYGRPRHASELRWILVSIILEKVFTAGIHYQRPLVGREGSLIDLRFGGHHHH